MVVGKGTIGFHPFLILGLSRRNIEKLLEEGKPILLTNEKNEAVPKDLSILIVAGETEMQIASQLRKGGVIEC